MSRVVRRLVAVLVTCAALTAPEAGNAATARVTNWVVDGDLLATFFFYVASPGERNRVTISFGPGSRATVTDTGALIVPGVGCSAVTRHKVNCSPADVWFARTGDRNDLVTFSGACPLCSWEVAGGPGNDVLHGGNFPFGSILAGGRGDDVLRGGRRDDALVGGPGSDILRGGGGTDWAVYSQRKTPVAVDLDGLADDGAVGERDLVATDVENVVGGTGADYLTGSSARNELKGRGGNDVLDGAGGNDAVKGEPGNDTIVGGSGEDRLSGGRGDDLIEARDNEPDQIDGGSEIDTGVIDHGLDATTNIESLAP